MARIWLAFRSPESVAVLIAALREAAARTACSPESRIVSRMHCVGFMATLSMRIYIYIYIHTLYVYMYVHVYIYIYIYIYMLSITLKLFIGCLFLLSSGLAGAARWCSAWMTRPYCCLGNQISSTWQGICCCSRSLCCVGHCLSPRLFLVIPTPDFRISPGGKQKQGETQDNEEEPGGRNPGMGICFCM